MLLVLALFLVLPTINVEPAWRPFELSRILWLVCLSNICLKSHDSVLFAAQALGDVSCYAYALIIG